MAGDLDHMVNRTRPYRTKDEATKKRESQAAQAVGAVIAFYRRARRKTQKKLVDGGDGIVSASVLAMIEGGLRLPTERALRFLCDQLGLSQYQTDQLRFLADDLDRSDEERLQTIMPSDVIRGSALFLRPPGDDSTLLNTAGVDEVWIVTRSPLTAKAPYYEMLRNRLKNGKLKSTYFLDSNEGKTEFVELFHALLNDRHLDLATKKVLAERLRCIIVPKTLTIFGFVLFNPNVSNRTFGRSVVMDPIGQTIGVIPMDTPKVAAAFSILSEIVGKVTTTGGAAIVHGVGPCELVAPKG